MQPRAAIVLRVLTRLLTSCVAPCGAGACSEDEVPPQLVGDPAAQVDPPADPNMPDLGACGDGPTESAVTSWNDNGSIDGFEATNTDVDCPRAPAACGSWWANLTPLGDTIDAMEGEVQKVTFATEPVDGSGDLCELHVADTVAGRVLHVRRDDVDNGVIDVVDFCLVDEHGHVATGLIELFSPIGVLGPERPPCD